MDILLAMIGIGLIVAIGLLVMELRRLIEKRNHARVEVVSEPEPTRLGWPGYYGYYGWPGYGPYYSHVPVRPLVI